MRDITDPANPYAGKYEEWDYWLFAAGRELTAADWQKLQEPENTLYYGSVGVDKDGFPVPQRQQLEEQYEKMNDRTAAADNACVLSFSACGEMPHKMRAAVDGMQYAIRASYMPQIPEWLAKSPPKWALLLPNNHVVTVGELGSGTLDQPGIMNASNTWDERTAAYSIYSPEGELLLQLEPGHDWFEYFFPDWKTVLGAYEQRGGYRWTQFGSVVVQDSANYNTLAVFNYDGTALPLETNIWACDMNRWAGIYGNEIGALYKAQQKN